MASGNTIPLLPRLPRVRLAPGARTTSWLLAAALLASGCALKLENRQAAQQLAEASQPPGSVYLGWRVFQTKCAGCHGEAATGTPNGPDLLPRMRAMGSRRFVSVVLGRYDWDPKPAQQPASLDALVEQILQRKAYPIAMPAWEGEPRVQAHLVDLYAYLSARATGSQDAGRPRP